MIAAGIPEWGNDYRTDIPANVGALKFYIKWWGHDYENINFTEVETRPCEWEDFDHSLKDERYSYIDSFHNVVESDKDPLFYPTRQNWGELANMWRDFYCISKPEELFINGNYDTFEGATLMVVFENCDDNNLPEGVDKCASKEDRDEWVTLRYIVTIENEKRFI